MKSFLRSARSNIVAGLLLVVPLAASLYILVKAFQFVDSALPDFVAASAGLLPAHWRLHTIARRVVDGWIPGMGIIIILVGSLLIGAAARNFLGRKLIRTGNAIIARIPVINKLYVGTQQILDAVVHNNKKIFERVVLVEYPRSGCHVMGFMTARASGTVARAIGNDTVTVFVPFAPTLTHGLLLHVPESSLIELEMNAEAALKHLVSAGIFSADKAAAAGELYQLPRSLKNWNWLRSLLRRDERGSHDPRD